MIFVYEIGEESLRKLLEQRPSQITLCSLGGDCYAMNAILDYLAKNPTPITATGIVASAAVPILAAGKQSERRATASTRFMVHAGSAATEGSPTDVKAEGDEAMKLDEMYWEVLAKLTKKKKAWWKKNGATTQFYFDAPKALELGIIDAIEE